jgi:sugar phosphate permease
MVNAETKRFVYRYRWVIFSILVITYFFVYFHRMSINAVGTEMIDDIGSGSKEYLSSIYFWTYAAMQIPSGLLADRLGPRKATTIFLALATVGSFLTCIATDFTVLAVGKMFIAAGMAVVYIPLMKIISVWYYRKDFPQLNGIVIAVGNVGALAAAAPLTYLADAVGWRNVFLILAVITMILAILCLTFIRDHPHDIKKPSLEEIRESETGETTEDRSDGKVPVLSGLATTFKSGRVFWTMGLAYFLIYGTIMVFQGTTSIAYFKSHVYTFALAAWFVTMIGVSKIVSTILIGRLTSRGIVNSTKKLMMFGTFMYMLVWAVIWLFAGNIQNEWFWFFICALFGFFAGFMTLSFSQVKEWFPVSISGTAMSAMNVLLFLGASIGTTIAGIVLHKEYVLSNYSTLWAIMFAATVIAFILVVLSKEKKEGDEMIMPKKTISKTNNEGE